MQHITVPGVQIFMRIQNSSQVIKLKILINFYFRLHAIRAYTVQEQKTVLDKDKKASVGTRYT